MNIPVPGCTIPSACNFDPAATQNDGSCTIISASANDISVQLDATGTASIVPADVDNGSGGGCTIASSSVAPNTFDVDDLGPVNAVLTVTDDQGNSAHRWIRGDRAGFDSAGGQRQRYHPGNGLAPARK